MFAEVLSKRAGAALEILGESGLLGKAYLAGGTALALRFGHRLSYDFDFFTPEDFDARILVQKLNSAPSLDFRLERTGEGTVLGYCGKTRFSIFFYKYPLLEKTENFSGIQIASAEDIAPMKLAAISDRGAKRDFIDLYFILSEEKPFSLEDTFKLYDKKFEAVKQNKLHLLKSLVYFEDAEINEMPKMLKPVSWERVKRFFEKEVKTLTPRLLQEKP